MPRRSIRILAAVAAAVGLLLVALVVYVAVQPEPPVAVETDDTKPFRIDPEQPFEVNYHAWTEPSGEGGGVIIKPGGVLTLRHRRGRDEDRDEKTATFTLTADELARVVRAVEAHRLMDLHKSYKLRGPTDGDRVKLLLRQGDRFKRVDCANHTPDELKAFADDLNAIVAPYRGK